MRAPVDVVHTSGENWPCIDFPRGRFAMRAQAFGHEPNALDGFRNLLIEKRIWLPGQDSNLQPFEVVKNLSALSGVAYMHFGTILASLAAPNPAPTLVTGENIGFAQIANQSREHILWRAKVSPCDPRSSKSFD